MTERHLVFPDVHLPYEGAAYRTVKKLASLIRPSSVISLGDFGEFLSVSRHIKPKAYEEFLIDEVAYISGELDWWLSQLKGKSRFIWILGNHEARVHKWLTENGRPLLDLVNFESLFLTQVQEPEKLVMIPYEPTQLYKIPGTTIGLRHEPRAGGASHTKGTAEKSSNTLIYGHTHVVQEYQHKDEEGRIRRAISLGCLLDMGQPVFSYRGNKDNWASACAVVTINTTTMVSHIEVINIVDGECCYGGKIIKA